MDSFPTCLQHLGVGQTEARNLTQLSLRVADIQVFEYLLLPPRVHITRKVELGVEPLLEPRYSGVGCGQPK